MSLTAIIALANALLDLAIRIYAEIAQSAGTPEQQRAKLLLALDELRKTRAAVEAVEL